MPRRSPCGSRSASRTRSSLPARLRPESGSRSGSRSSDPARQRWTSSSTAPTPRCTRRSGCLRQYPPEPIYVANAARARSAKAANGVVWRKLAVLEHRELQLRPVAFVLVHERARGRLDDVVNVHGNAAGMRPEACVDLFGRHKLVHDGGRPMQERAELGSLVGVELGNASHVTLRLDEQCPDPERPDAV